MNKNVQKKEAQMWAQLEAYLIQELDRDTARTILTESQTKAHAFLAASEEPSPTRRATMQDTILPRVATYLALKEAGQDAEGLMERYTRTVAGPSMHAFYAKAEKVPFFYAIFKALFGMVTRKSDAWVSDFAVQKGQFTLDIHRCLWYDTCCACGAPEACRFFCECDNYTYGDLKKVGFARTQTLGTGGDKCDFRFYKK